VVFGVFLQFVVSWTIIIQMLLLMISYVLVVGVIDFGFGVFVDTPGL